MADKQAKDLTALPDPMVSTDIFVAQRSTDELAKVTPAQIADFYDLDLILVNMFDTM